MSMGIEMMEERRRASWKEMLGREGKDRQVDRWR